MKSFRSRLPASLRALIHVDGHLAIAQPRLLADIATGRRAVSQRNTQPARGDVFRRQLLVCTTAACSAPMAAPQLTLVADYGPVATARRRCGSPRQPNAVHDRREPAADLFERRHAAGTVELVIGNGAERRRAFYHWPAIRAGCSSRVAPSSPASRRVWLTDGTTATRDWCRPWRRHRVASCARGLRACSAAACGGSIRRLQRESGVERGSTAAMRSSTAAHQHLLCSDEGLVRAQEFIDRISSSRTAATATRLEFRPRRIDRRAGRPCARPPAAHAAVGRVATGWQKLLLRDRRSAIPQHVGSGTAAR